MKTAFIGLLGLLFVLSGGTEVIAAPTISATLSATPTSFSGKCPAKIKFNGMIAVSAPTKIQYKFIRSDGANAPVQTLNFTGAGSKSVDTTWTLGGPGLPTYEGWEAIQVVYPQQVKSNKAEFKVLCAEGQGGKKPDLVIQDIIRDKDCNVAVRVRNVGAGKIPDEVWTFHTPDSCAVYLSSNGHGWGGATIWLFDPGRALQNPGGTAVYRSNLKIAGAAVIKAEIDHTGKVMESNESNNVRTEKLSCQTGGAGQPGQVNEDCVSFNPDTVAVQQISGDWKIVDGSHWMFSFGNKKGEADKVFGIIKKYRLNRSCFVGRPDPSFRYMLIGNTSPVGAMAGEDCVSFNPDTATVQQISGDWKIVDGSHWMFSFGSKKDEAEKTLAIIKKYGFTRSCFVGRPDPSFSYLRK
jgi:hypothetical protein